MGRFLTALFLLPLALAQTPPAPGKMVDVGGYRVHLYCTGEGSPTVMIVGAGFSMDWALVQPVVARHTRVCTYDPSGMAWSDPVPGPVSCPSRVAEIHAMLRSAGIAGPYVLVGLSIGGLVARVYAQRYPDEVSGMVIVDHAFLNPSDGAPAARIVAPGLDSPPVLISQTPIEYTMEDISNFSNLPESSRKLHRWAMSLDPVMPTVEEAEACTKEAGDRKLGDMPLVVISTANDSPHYAELQKQLLALSASSRQIYAVKSFHAVEIDQPEIVTEAIIDVVGAVRKLAH